MRVTNDVALMVPRMSPWLLLAIENGTKVISDLRME
jgi:hypothetical protein